MDVRGGREADVSLPHDFLAITVFFLSGCHYHSSRLWHTHEPTWVVTSTGPHIAIPPYSDSSFLQVLLLLERAPLSSGCPHTHCLPKTMAHLPCFSSLSIWEGERFFLEEKRNTACIRAGLWPIWSFKCHLHYRNPPRLLKAGIQSSFLSFLAFLKP